MKEKRLDFEILRLIAIVLVVFNHTQQRGFELYRVAGGSAINNAVSLILAVTCKIAVPLFFMVSGGLLLHKDENIRTVFKKRVLRIAAALVLFSGILYCFWSSWGYIETPGLRDYFSRLWSEGISIPYWYLYAYGALMLMLPLLRSMVRTLPNSAFLYLLLLHFIYQGVIGPVGYLLGFGEFFGTVHVTGSGAVMNVYFPLVEQTLFYFLMGYYMAHRFPWELVTKRKLSLAAVLSGASIGLMAWLTWHDYSSHGYSTHNFMGDLLFIPVFTVYTAVHYLVERYPIQGRLRKVILSLGGCTFGTYLLEGILRHELLPLYDFLEPKIHVLPACFVWVAAVVVCGLAITWVLKKIPVLKKIL